MLPGTKAQHQSQHYSANFFAFSPTHTNVLRKEKNNPLASLPPFPAKQNRKQNTKNPSYTTFFPREDGNTFGRYSNN